VDTQTSSLNDGRQDADRYEIRVRGRLDGRWAAWFDDMTLDTSEPEVTVLRGRVADQAALHGLLARLRDLGLPLVSVVPDRVLRTDRLTLRAATAQDAETTWAYRRLDSVNEWLTGRPDDLAGYRELFAEPDRLATTVVVQLGRDPSGPVIGDFMLRRRDAWAQVEVADRARGCVAELGWVLDPAHVGHGYATEAVRELLRHCFEDLGVRRVVADCFLANEASWRLMERVGMRREVHAVQESLHRSGAWLDTVGYALLAEEWRVGS
jgi:RimJ/RimL family protein N-acetyltransferase